MSLLVGFVVGFAASWLLAALVVAPLVAEVQDAARAMRDLGERG